MNSPIWPKVDIRTERKKLHGQWVNSVDLYTTLRLKHRGKWYKQNFWRNASSTENSVEALVSRAYKELIYSVYMAQHFSKVMPNVKDCNGCYVWPLDEDQRDEKTRLENL